MNKINDVIIIGAGPAGISAAIQLKRYGIGFLLLEKDCIGGLLKNASLVENYPGFPKGITGLKLVNLFKKHLSELGIGIKNGNVINVDCKNKLYSVQTERNNFLSKNLIIATGTKPKKYEVKGSSTVKVYYEVHKLFNVRNKDIAIIGGGDAAFDYAFSLSGNGNNISILYRSAKPVCIPALLKKVLLKKNISYFCNLNINQIYKENKIVIESKNKTLFKVDYLIAAIGRESQLDFVKKEKMKKLKYLKGKSLFYIGDVKNKIYRQATISIGDGIHTAIRISQKLKDDYEDNS
jgi:thioredoxin reductase (NADPH)